MGIYIFIPLPIILLVLIIALAAYLIGRARGRSLAPRTVQHFGPPAPPFQGHPSSEGKV
ncbi:hypothetical protein RND81_01G036700 [Saponaria officinalis]|uniref:Uncharacterized protein n=1 Tax=Saponaria officinalis TaxID=3572 RepID=A0AAW1NB88_SAPOF